MSEPCVHFTESGNAHERCVVCGIWCVTCFPALNNEPLADATVESLADHVDSPDAENWEDR